MITAGALAGAFLIVSWIWAAINRELSAANFALWSIATWFVAGAFL